MNSYASIFKNSFFGILAQITYRASNALLFILIANRFGDVEAGIYTLGLAFFIISSRLSFLGLDHLLIREVAKEPEEMRRYYVSFAAVRILLGTALVIAVSFYVYYSSGYQPETIAVILVMLGAVVPENITNLNLACFTAREEVYWNSVVFAVNGITRLGLGATFIFMGLPILFVAQGYLAAQILTLIVGTIIVFRRYIHHLTRPSLSFIKTTLYTSGSFFVISAFYILDNRFDNLILSGLRDEAALGVYSLAFNIVSIFLIIPAGFRTALLPVLSKQNETDPAELKSIYINAYRYLLWLGLPISIALYILAEPVLAFLYQDSPLIAIVALQMMGIAVFGMFINVLNARLLIAQNRQSLVALTLIISMVINLGLNFMLVPAWGEIGTAVARTASFLILFAGNSAFVIAHFKQLGLWRIYAPITGAGFAMGAALYFLNIEPRSIFLSAAVGFIIFALTLWAFGGITPQEQQIARKTIGKVVSFGNSSRR